MRDKYTNYRKDKALWIPEVATFFVYFAKNQVQSDKEESQETKELYDQILKEIVTECAWYCDQPQITE